MWRRLLAAEGGNMAILFAGALALASVVAAFAVDAGSLYLERRMLQTAVDLAALEAARDPANARAVAREVLVDAGVIGASVTVEQLADPDNPTRLEVETGQYAADSGIAPQDRFQAGATAINAVRVVATKPGRLYFANSWSPIPEMSASATASVTPLVAFSIGSRLARLEGGLVNGLLNTLLGTTVKLTAADYNGLVGAKVDAFAYLDALAFELGLTVGTYDDVLAVSATQNQLVKALARALSGTEAAAASLIAGVIGNTGLIPVNKLLSLGDLGRIDIGSGGEDLYADIAALDILMATATLGGAGKQVGLNLSVDLGSIAAIKADLAIGEPPQFASWFAIGPTGAVARTAQVRLRLLVSLLGDAGLIKGSLVRVPLYVEVAHAEAIVGAASCPVNGGMGSATILTRPGALRLMVGEVSDSSLRDFNTQPALRETRLVGLLIADIYAKALIEVAQSSPIPLSFSSREIASETVKTATTRTIVGSLVGTLLSHLTIRIDVFGGLISISLALVTQLLAALLTPVTPVLDAIVNLLLDTLGLGLGEADVRVYGVTCGHPVLVG
ncbi:hypothetical protein VE25_19960 [Devosia geojensis]|uniref:Putative Flp pilus-assembly TadG-like N-terminal domain-containing protein n=1 Tax=Devosia geojensis TaxID=443610 RepID=A0A0F5FFF7_9HYPH|nr:pilus assembly protein TadG-related protein [Devosia geojensis]KKB06937.1 hypothetical protein VE25_19960 [Devosia geojensis]